MAKKNAANAPDSAPVRHETDPATIVKIELQTINGKPFLGQISDDELLYIWTQVFKRKKTELYGITSTKTLTRHVRATFKLKHPIKLTEEFGREEFAYEKILDDGNKEEVTGKILGYAAKKPAELGDLVRVTVKANLLVESSGILNWLKLYGVVTTGDFQTNPSTGLKTDVYEAELVLKKHIGEYLPIYGQKAQIFYAGIPRQCNRCYKVGHLRRDCQNKKKDWIAYVIELLEEGVEESLIGTWKNAVERFKSSNESAFRT
jgi:hypothetical protein